MKILVINGPNLNFLGIREPNIYGGTTYSELIEIIKRYCDERNIDVSFFQSNHEGFLIDKIQEAYYEKYDGIIINPGAYTHTSIALMDAIKSVNIKTIEVHISDLSKRESFRQVSYISKVCDKTITGLGINGYLKAIDYFIN